MQILGIGVAILAFLLLVFRFLAAAPRSAMPKKTAITNPPWASALDFTCPLCGHKDQATDAVVRCVKCRAIILKHSAEPGELPRNTCDSRSPFLGGGD